MKNFSILIFVALVALIGCKPQEVKPPEKIQTTLSGQMFIVTQGAESIKLGDVEICLIEKSQVADFLRRKQAVIEAEITDREIAVDAAEKKVALAQTNYESLFSANVTNSDYLKMQDELEIISNEVVPLEEKFRSLPEGSDEEKQALKEMSAKYSQKYELQQKMDVPRNALQTKIDELLHDEQTANSFLENAKTRLQNFPTSEDLADFLPVISQETRTDADGKFSFVYDRNQALTVFATAQRKVLDKTEKYYWFVNAPTNAESVQIFLSNNNLASVAP